MFHVKHYAPPLVRLRAFCRARLVFVPRPLAYPETNVSRETPHVRRLPQAFSRPTEAPRPRPGPARLAFMRLACVPPRAPHPRPASASPASRSHPPGPRASLASPAPPPAPRPSRPPGPARRPRASRSHPPRPARLACAPPRAPRHAGPQRLTSRPQPRASRLVRSPRLSHAPPGPERLTSRPLPRNPCSRLLHPSCSPVAPPFPFVALSMPGLSKSKRHQLRFYQHLHSTSTFATQQLSGRLNDRLSAFTQVTGGFSPRNNREGALTRPHEASMVILGELNSLTGINET